MNETVISYELEVMTWAFRLAGLMMVGLVGANFVGAKRLGYAPSLVGASKIVRQIFYVHCGYIVMLIAGLAILCLGWPEWLLVGDLARVLCGFFAVFWISRVLVQLFYYDAELRAQERFWDVFFLLVFGVLGLIFVGGVLR